MILLTLCALPAGAVDWLPTTCNARQTVGIQQRTGDAGETHLPTVFSEQTFDLRENAVFMRHLLGERAGTEATERDETAPSPGAVQLYVTMILDGGAEAEFECRTVRGAAGNQGYSCVNNPPSEMLLINPARGRYSRSSIGGWVFYAPEASLFVEYGTCGEQTPAESEGVPRR